jgi:hypothetical protein
MSDINFLSVVANNLNRLQEYSGAYFDKFAKYNQPKSVAIQRSTSPKSFTSYTTLGIMFPNFNTIIDPIPLTYPIEVVKDDAILKNYSQYQSNKLIEEIDINRLKATPSYKLYNSKYSIYKISELKEFAKLLGLPSNGNKDHLVEIILQRILT